MRHQFLGSWLIALAAAAAALASLPPDGNGPGVTCDEFYHVLQGKHLVAALRHQGLAFFRPANLERNFVWPHDGPPVQAPLGHWILGWTHHLFDPAPDDPTSISITAARFAPAVAFGLLAALIGMWIVRYEGLAAGMAASAAVALVPRMFGHAHLAALDMLTALFFVAAVLAAVEAMRGGRLWHFALAGVLWGATFLIRLHGALIVPPVVIWMVWRLRRRAVWPVVCWLAAGATTFFVGWPWLWISPWDRFGQYLATGPMRQALHVFYLGQVWSDRDVPWHYPWAMFLATVPVGFLILGAFGVGEYLIRWKTDASKAALTPCPSPKWRGEDVSCRPPSSAFRLPPSPLSLPLGVMLFVLVVFSLPGVPVYDGARLFLMVFPLWAIAVGAGVRLLIETPRWRLSLRCALLAIFVAMQGVGLIIYHPCHLSHYNLLVGGLPGALRWGFEATYWGDAVREPMLAEASRRSPGAPILLAPHLAPFQAAAMTLASPALCRSENMLIGYDPSLPEEAKKCRYAVVYRRRADGDIVERLLSEGQVVSEYNVQGEWLARLIEIAPPARRRRQGD